MRTFRLDKLVHDGIVQGHHDEGGQVDFVVLEGEALTQALEAKHIEEMAELAGAATEEDKAKEQQDIKDVDYALGRLVTNNFVPKKTFTKAHFIRTVTLPDSSWLVDYYAADPVRFPEITDNN